MPRRNPSERKQNSEMFLRLKEEMQKFGHTQKKFLDLLKKIGGVKKSIGVLGMYGRGSRMPDDLIAACKKLGYDTNFILNGGNGIPQNSSADEMLLIEKNHLSKQKLINQLQEKDNQLQEKDKLIQEYIRIVASYQFKKEEK